MRNITNSSQVLAKLVSVPVEEENNISTRKNGIRVTIVSYHLATNSLDRPSYVARALRGMPFISNVTLVSSNFDHSHKCISQSGNDIRLPVRGYSRNISLQRLLSYFDFARQIKKAKEVLEADLVYVCMPDYLSALAVIEIKKDRKILTILDVVDLWPEAFPFPSVINHPIKWCSGKIIKPLRRFLFASADLVLFQSNHFLTQFGGDERRYGLLSMCLPERSVCIGQNNPLSVNCAIRILFLGSMNSITDIISLEKFLVLLCKYRNVQLSVVGGGVGLERLVKRLNRSPVRVIFHGITFDQELISKELCISHFGFNGYKMSTEVAVSYKSLDYLQAGLPIINCTKGDLMDIVDEYYCGFNYSPHNIEVLVEKVLHLSDEEHGLMRENARKVFNDKFSFARFVQSLNSHVRKLV